MKKKDIKRFSNINVYYEFNGVKYIGNIEIVDNEIKLKINMTGNINEWRNTPKEIDIINVKTVLENVPISLINCYNNGHKSIGIDENAILYTYYSIERVIYDYNLIDLNNLITNEVSVVYSDLEHMTECKNYELDVKDFKIKPLIKTFNVNLSFAEINIRYISQISEKCTSIEINRVTEFNIKFIKELCMSEIIEKIYMFKNLLMILLKRNISVENIYLIVGLKKIELYDCFKINHKSATSVKSDKTLNHRCMKFEKLINIDEIFENFSSNYEILYPILELYFNVVQTKIPDHTRLVNCCVMIEYFSRQFDDSNAQELTKNKYLSKSKKVKEAEYYDRVKSLILKVNSVYNFTTKEIETISDKIKDARTYFIHFQKGNKFRDSEEFYFNYFIEDIILINIYLLIGIKLNDITYITFENYIYNKKNLI